MPTRFKPALAQAVADLEGQPGVTGILFFGSGLTGPVGPTSDLDLYVILDDEHRWSQILLRRYAGVEAEIHFGPVSFWRPMLEAGRPVTVHAFATGQAVLDRTGALGDLVSLARVKEAEGPPALPEEAVSRLRYHLTDLANDLDDVAGQPADERLVASRLVALSLEAYCELNRLWGEKPKRLIPYIERHNSQLGRMVRHFYNGELDPHLAQGILDRVLAPFGGRLSVWESPRRPVE